jgi:hypothetical protein
VLAENERIYHKSKMDQMAGAKGSTDITQGCDDGSRLEGMEKRRSHDEKVTGQVVVIPDSGATPLFTQRGDWIVHMNMGLGAV